MNAADIAQRFTPAQRLALLRGYETYLWPAVADDVNAGLTDRTQVLKALQGALEFDLSTHLDQMIESYESALRDCEKAPEKDGTREQDKRTAYLRNQHAYWKGERDDALWALRALPDALEKGAKFTYMQKTV